MGRVITYILVASFFLNANLCLAESLNLGNFSEENLNNNFFKDIALKINKQEFNLDKEEMRKWIIEKENLSYDKNYDSEIENTNICKLNKSIICNLTFILKKENHIKKNSQFFLSEDLIKKFIDDLARQINKDPTNAKLQIENGKVSFFDLSSNGIELDKENSFKVIMDYLKGNKETESMELGFIEKKPEVSIDSIDNLGIVSLIGEGKSNFRGSPKNRIFNIKVATNRFNGILIKPGEEFSFTKILGEVDGDHGYLPELVIKKDKTEPEFGGGICQVSTTAFRAAIYSGLEITARRNHAYPVSYYNPQGMDATVYVPRPDLRFINDTPAHILIQTKIEGTELTFQFYGTDDGRKTEVVGPKITERRPDGGMKATFTQKVFDKDGNIIREDVFNSNYDSPDKYPHPGQALTQKPAGWSDKEWSKYKKDNKL